MNWRIGTGLLVGFLTVAPGVSAQQPPQRPPSKEPSHAQPGDQPRGERREPSIWWRDEKSKAELKLTADQAQRIEEVFQPANKVAQERFDRLRRLEDQLNVRISANDATEAEVIRLADQMEAIRSVMSKDRVLMLFRIRRLLSPEQRAQLFEMQRRRQPGRAPTDLR